MKNEEKIINNIRGVLLKKYGVTFSNLPKEKQEALIAYEIQESFKKIRA